MSGSMLMRLIDVVLIILFGFIGISDIQNKTQLKLPGQSTSEPIQEEIVENVFVQLVIHNIGRELGEFEIYIEGERPINAQDLMATVMHVMGVDRDHTNYTGLGRPLTAVDASGKAIRELLDV